MAERPGEVLAGLACWSRIELQAGRDRTGRQGALSSTSLSTLPWLLLTARHGLQETELHLWSVWGVSGQAREGVMGRLAIPSGSDFLGAEASLGGKVWGFAQAHSGLNRTARQFPRVPPGHLPAGVPQLSHSLK